VLQTPVTPISRRSIEVPLQKETVKS